MVKGFNNENTHSYTQSPKVRAKQIGVACLKHDLTHSLECGRCYRDMKEALENISQFNLDGFGENHNESYPTPEAEIATRALEGMDK